MKVLILYASYGDGHLQVAKVLQECFLEQGASQVLLVDLYANAYPLLNKLARFMYLFSSSYCPHLYGWSYYLTQNSWRRPSLVRVLDIFGRRALNKSIREEKPDVVINTFPLSVVPEWRRRNGGKLPIYTVITDFVLHDRWLHQEMDRYYVACPEIKETMIKKGIQAERIKVSGIPVRKEFSREQTLSRQQIYARYGLEPGKKTVLLMAGAYGVLRNLEKIARLLVHYDDIQVVLVCGKNKALREKMEELLGQEKKIHIFGFVEQVYELMAISSCMVTKAGGVTLSEALALSLPVVVFQPLPGQEKDNALLLSKKGAVMIANTVEELLNQVRRLLYEQNCSLRMQRAMQALAKKNAAATIVRDILMNKTHWD